MRLYLGFFQSSEISKIRILSFGHYWFSCSCCPKRFYIVSFLFLYGQKFISHTHTHTYIYIYIYIYIHAHMHTHTHTHTYIYIYIYVCILENFLWLFSENDKFNNEMRVAKNLKDLCDVWLKLVPMMEVVGYLKKIMQNLFWLRYVSTHSHVYRCAGEREK